MTRQAWIALAIGGGVILLGGGIALALEFGGEKKQAAGGKAIPDDRGNKRPAEAATATVRESTQAESDRDAIERGEHSKTAESASAKRADSGANGITEAGREGSEAAAS